eukprot:6284656-Alexandrium_andersonii.AAC.1
MRGGSEAATGGEAQPHFQLAHSGASADDPRARQCGGLQAAHSGAAAGDPRAKQCGGLQGQL